MKFKYEEVLKDWDRLSPEEQKIISLFLDLQFLLSEYVKGRERKKNKKLK